MESMMCYNYFCMFLSLKTTKEKNLYKESIGMITKQISDTFKNSKFSNEQKLKAVKNIVINGMGGSNLGAAIVCSLFKKDLKIPVAIEPGYDIPGFVGKETAYIVSSYSGTTEEPLVAYKKAKARGALIIAVTALANNKLAELAKKDGFPTFEFPTKANPSGQPRLGLGASLASFIIILTKLGALKNSLTKDLLKANKKKNDNSLKLAANLKNKEIILVSSALFAGNLKTLRNQLNESAKNMASFLTISDMNHHALEGLSFPKNNKKRLAALFIDSKLDDQKIQKRADISKEIFKRQKIKVYTYQPIGKNLLEQSLDLLQFGAYLSYHIAIQNHVNPSDIPWVDWFKKKLSN